MVPVTLPVTTPVLAVAVVKIDIISPPPPVVAPTANFSHIPIPTVVPATKPVGGMLFERAKPPTLPALTIAPPPNFPAVALNVELVFTFHLSTSSAVVVYASNPSQKIRAISARPSERGG